jgi:hypothetical protein
VAYDPSIIAAIRREAARVDDPRKRDRYLRAALQTGIVESGLRNLNYGDADSQGWRQERASLYPNPTNVSASVRRFFQEAAQHDRGQPSWELAADVQRPAAQYRGRYKDVAQQAAALLGGGARTARARPTTRATTTEQTQVPFSALTLAKPQIAITAPTRPDFGQPNRPVMYQTPVTSPPPQPEPGAALEALQTITRTTPGATERTPREPSSPSGALSPGGNYSGTTRPVEALARIAHEYGLTTTSGKRPTVNTASGNVSDHYEGNKVANARDLGGTVPEMDRAAVALAKKLGIKGYKKGQRLEKTITRGGLRYQILYRTNTGGDHFDHIHVGVKRA